MSCTANFHFVLVLPKSISRVLVPLLDGWTRPTCTKHSTDQTWPLQLQWVYRYDSSVASTPIILSTTCAPTPPLSRSVRVDGLVAAAARRPRAPPPLGQSQPRPPFPSWASLSDAAAAALWERKGPCGPCGPRAFFSSSFFSYSSEREKKEKK